MHNWLDEIHWNEAGLVPAIAQDYQSQRILMLAWMNKEALEKTCREGWAVYWSRSRNKLWRKGEESGHLQKVHKLELDCDGDAIVLHVAQTGGISCHTGRASCFYRQYQEHAWVVSEPVVRDPESVYRKKP